MAHVSRPFQIALAAVVLLGGVWLFALRGQSSPSGETSSKGSTPPAAAHASKPSSIYHGSAPGVEGLTKAIAKAHGAVTTSEQNARRLEQKSAQASGESAASATAAAPAKAAPTVASKSAKAPASPAHAPASAAVAHQRAVEARLNEGHVVLILFWSPKGSDDRAVVHAVAGLGRGHVSTFMASADEVASFGTVTRGVQIYGTPTLLVVGKSHQAKVLTGLIDSFAIQQAIAEAH